MRSADTNVLARLILADHEEQSALAAAVVEEQVWITATVWLELGWVLAKRLDRASVAAALTGLLETETVHTFDRDGIGWAIGRYAAGADWADMVHLVAARGVTDRFVTFDHDMARRCGDAPPVPVETLG